MPNPQPVCSVSVDSLRSEVTPVYASILREPYSRYVSWYYFMRYGDGNMNETGLLTRLGPDAARPNEVTMSSMRFLYSEHQEVTFMQHY